MSAGILSQISFAPETTWGVPVTPNKSLAVQPGDGIQTDRDIRFHSAIKAQIAKNTGAFIGNTKHKGGYEFDFIPGFSGYLLKSLFGGVVSALKGGETIVYNHTYSESAVHPSLTVEQAIEEIVRRYAGVIGTALKLSLKSGEEVKMNIEALAKSSASATKITPVWETVRPFNFADCISPAGFKLAGTNFADKLENFEFEYKNNVQVKHATSIDPVLYFAKPSEVSWKADLYLDSGSAAKYEEYLNKTEQSMQIILTGDAIGVSSNYKFDLTVHRNALKTINVPITNDLNMLSIEGEGIYDTATSKLLTPILTNLLANYN